VGGRSSSRVRRTRERQSPRRRSEPQAAPALTDVRGLAATALAVRLVPLRLFGAEVETFRPDLTAPFLATSSVGLYASLTCRLRRADTTCGAGVSAPGSCVTF
jgi:hypothetical protein